MKSSNKQTRNIFPAIFKPKREDWDFSKVPDEELTTCYFYEYARESMAIKPCSRACRQSNGFQSGDKSFGSANPKRM